MIYFTGSIYWWIKEQIALPYIYFLFCIVHPAYMLVKV